MKIIIWSAFFIPNLGGVERYTYNIAKKFIEKGMDVTVITSSIGKQSQIEEIEKIKIVRMEVFNFLKGRLPVLKIWGKNYKIIKELKRERFDLSIINARFYPHSLLGAIVSKKNSKKIMLLEHGSGYIELNNKFLNRIGIIYENLITFFLKRYVKNFYGTTKLSNKWLENFGIKPKGIFYNSISEKIEKNKNFDLKREYNLLESEIIFTFSGRLIKEKGVLKTIDSFEKFSKKNKNVTLFIIGNGELYTYIKNKNKNSKIIITGEMEHQKLIKAFEQTDVFLLPSDYPEGLPTTILEAGLERCAIIASNKGGISEVIIDENHGILLEDNNESEIEKAMEKIILENKFLIMGKNVRKRVLENFEWSKTSLKILKEYEGME